MAYTIDDLHTDLQKLIKIMGGEDAENFSGSRLQYSNGERQLKNSGINISENDSDEEKKLKKEILDALNKINSKSDINNFRSSYPDILDQYKNIETYLKALEEGLKYQQQITADMADLEAEFEAEMLKYEEQDKDIRKRRKQAETENYAYTIEQRDKSSQLALIEAKVRKEHIEDIRKLYKREVEIRDNGLVEMEQKQNQVKEYVKQTKSKVAVSEDYWFARKGQYSAGKELWNKVILGPLQEKWFSVFGNDKRGLQSTQTLGTSLVKGLSSALNGTAKFGNAVNSGKMNVTGIADNISSKLMSTGNPYAMATGAAVNILKTAFDMYSKVDKAASDYARTVGGGNYAQVKMRKTAANLAVEMGNLGERTYNAEKILANMAETSEALGRNLEYLSTADIKAINDLKDFGISTATISQFDTLGISISRVSEEITSIYGKAGKHGLNAKAVTKIVADNLKLAQNYTFARGRKAIFDMAEKSAQLKFNLRDAESFANKVGTLEGAMKSAAQLSVLGGSFAMQGNPLTLLYNALNDVEGLQDQMLAMTKDLVFWDQNKKQLDMSAFDRQRLKAMSEATGIDYNELTTQAFNQERVRRISRQLPAGMGKETSEYIKNLAVLDENGNARIQFHNAKGDNEGEAKLLKDLTTEDIARLRKESEEKDAREGADVGSILSSTRSIQDQLDDIVNQLKNFIVKGIMRIIDLSGGDSNALTHGFDKEQSKQYQRLKKILDNKNLTAADYRSLSKEDQAAVRAMGIFNSSGGLVYKDRFSDGKTVSWSQTSDLLADKWYNSNEYKQLRNKKDSEAQPVKVSGFDNGGGNLNAPEDQVVGLQHGGELTLPKKVTQELIKNGTNPLDFKEFQHDMANRHPSSDNVGGSNNKSIMVEFGTLHLELGGITKDIDMNAFANLLLSNQSFIQTLIQKMTNIGNFGYEKDNAQFPVANNPYSNMA